MPAREPRARLFPAPLPQATLSTAQRLACLRLIRSDNVGPITFRELINHCGGAEEALDALPRLSRRGGRARIRVCSREQAEEELAAAAAIGAQPLFTIEPGYPTALANVDAPPPMIYAKGDLRLLLRPMVAIVGARDCSAAGQKIARLFADSLGRAGYVVASGLARGIDAAAHAAALEHGTVAVMAGGIDAIYPPENAHLHRDIGERGCLITEMPPGFFPRGKDFPRRNRIISGVSMGVVVVEAARRSGSLTTARMAKEQSREVFVLPGHPLDPRAEGTNALLKGGEVTMVTAPDDVIAALAPMLREPAAPFEAQPEAPADLPGPAEPRAAAGAVPADVSEADLARVLAALGPAPIDIDELARATGLPARSLRAALLELDITGHVRRHGHQLVSLAPSSAG